MLDATDGYKQMVAVEGFRVLREIDQNIIVPKGDLMDRNNKGGTRRRRVSEKKQCGKRDQCAKLECVTNKTCKPGKREFQLVDEEEQI